MLSDLSHEMRLLLSCSGHRVEPIELERVNWGRFLLLAKRHRVQGVVRSALSIYSDKVPEDVQFEIDTAYKQNTIRTLHQLSLMNQISVTLTAANIEYMFVKGVLLADSYSNLPDRHAGDVDVLIRSSSRIWEAVNLLRELGLQGLNPKIELNEAQAKEFLRRSKDIVLYSEKYKMRVELHSRLIGNERLWMHSTENIFENVDSRSINARLYPSMSRDTEGFYVMLHGGLDCWFRLKWLFDAHLIFKNCHNDEFEAMYKYASSQGLQRVFLLCMQLLVMCFDMETPSWVKRLGESDKAVQAMYLRSLQAFCNEKTPIEINSTVSGTVAQFLAGTKQQISMKSGTGHILSSIDSRIFNTRNWETVHIPSRFHVLHKPFAPLIVLLRVIRKIYTIKKN